MKTYSFFEENKLRIYNQFEKSDMWIKTVSTTVNMRRNSWCSDVTGADVNFVQSPRVVLRIDEYIRSEIKLDSKYSGIVWWRIAIEVTGADVNAIL